jgi:hypothetical protein
MVEINNLMMEEIEKLDLQIKNLSVNQNADSIDYLKKLKKVGERNINNKIR